MTLLAQASPSAAMPISGAMARHEAPALVPQAPAGSVGGDDPVSNAISTADTAAATCSIYAVHDAGSNDSQFFTIDLRAKTTRPLGPLHADYDIEGLDLHPTTQMLYASAGSGNRHGQDGLAQHCPNSPSKPCLARVAAR